MLIEPSTLLTDYALGSLCAWLAWRLYGVARQTRQRAVRIWALAFAATSLGSFTAGTYHGFQLMLPPALATMVWTTTTLVVGLAACLLLTATLVATVRRRVRRWWLFVVWAQFVAYAAWMLRHHEFVYVIAEYGAAMLCVFALVIASARLRTAARWVTAGIGVTIAAAVVQQSGFDLHRHLNHNDLQHLVQMIAVWLLYRGGARLSDAPEQ
jgi:drug/metabolite transporter (DMT)-like permease